MLVCTNGGVDLPVVIDSKILGDDDLRRDATYEATEISMIDPMGGSIATWTKGTTFTFSSAASSCGVIDLARSKLYAEIAPFILMPDGSKIRPVGGYVCQNDFPSLFQSAVLSIGTIPTVDSVMGAGDCFFFSEAVKRISQYEGSSLGTAVVSGKLVTSNDNADGSTLSPLSTLLAPNTNSTQLNFKKSVTEDCSSPFDACVDADYSVIDENNSSQSGEWQLYPDSSSGDFVGIGTGFLYRTMTVNRSTANGRSKASVLASPYVIQMAQQLPIAVKGLIPTNASFRLQVTMGDVDKVIRGDTLYSLTNALSSPLSAAGGYTSGSTISIGYDLVSLQLGLCIRRLTPRAADIMREARLLRYSYLKYSTVSYPLPASGNLMVQVPTQRRAKALVIAAVPNNYLTPLSNPALSTPNIITVPGAGPPAPINSQYQMYRVFEGSLKAGGLSGLAITSLQVSDVCGQRYPSAGDRWFSDFTPGGVLSTQGSMRGYEDFKTLLKDKGSVSYMQWRNHLRWYAVNMLPGRSDLSIIGAGEDQGGSYNVSVQYAQDVDSMPDGVTFAFTGYTVFVTAIYDGWLDYELGLDGSCAVKAY